MSQFRIRLITPNNDLKFINNDHIPQYESFLATTITDFNSQEAEYNNNKNNSTLLEEAIRSESAQTQETSYSFKHTYSYTYNEKLSLHKHGQKELSFNMDERIMVNDTWIENPFARTLHNGVQLELTDKYNHVMLFTVKKITHNFNNLSTVYNVTCQDSFTYQLSRQNNGYQIKNDETSIDFIGALDIDAWANKIIKECYVTYIYVPLYEGIYKDNDGYIHTFKTPGNGIDFAAECTLTNCDKVIKPIYNRNNYKDFYETFPFSVSGSNASAALIALGDLLGLQLNVVEGYKQNDEELVYNRFVYFGPVKNPDVTGLEYSPLRDIQNFDLTLSGDSLTTVLNVKSTTWDNEEIGLFPKIPNFFISYILTSSSWKNSKYYHGYFLDIIKGQQYTNKSLFDIEHPIRKEGSPTLIPINTDVLGIWSSDYDKIYFSWDNDHYTQFRDSNQFYNSKQNTFSLQLYTVENNNLVLDRVYYEGDTILKEDITAINNGLKRPYLSINESTEALTIVSVYVHITREWTEEEYAFATIAEECPWLENKLIDFSYFLHQNILSKAEYENLIDIIVNDLRIINGELMCYANVYYEAIHKQTKVLAQLQETADRIGAELNALITSYSNTGHLPSNTTSFVDLYTKTFNTIAESRNPEQLINLNNIISDYFNKYFNAEQRFFKNIYEFRKFFDEKNIFATSNERFLDEVTYTINGPTGVLISFDTSASTFDQLDSNSPIIRELDGHHYSIVPLYRWDYNKYVKMDIPNPQNFKDFYISLVEQNTINPVPNNHLYNAQNTYLWKGSISDFENKFNRTPVSADVITKTEGGSAVTYIKMLYSDIKKLFLSTHTGEYYIRDTEYKVPFEYVRCNVDVLKETISPALWPELSNLNDTTKFQVTSLANKDNWVTYWNWYKHTIPLDTLYIKDYSFNYITDTNENKVIWQINDENGHPYMIEQPEEDTYSFKKYNLLTKTYETIDKANLYQSYYSIPLISLRDSASLSVNADTAVNPSLEDLVWYLTLYQDKTPYLVKHREWDHAKGWTNFAVGVTSGGHPAAVPFYQNPWVYRWYNGSQTHFAAWHYKGNEIVANQENRKTTQFDLGDIDHYNKPDSVYVNFSKVEDIDEQIKALTKSLIISDAYKAVCGDSNTYYKHYINYYTLIAATYSVGSQLHPKANDTTDFAKEIIDDYDNSSYVPSVWNNVYDKFYVNNKYARFCKRTDIFNPNDEYVWVPVKMVDGQNTYNMLTPTAVSAFLQAQAKIRFGAIKFYPLVLGKQSVDFTCKYNNDDLQKKHTLGDTFSPDSTQESPFIFEIQNSEEETLQYYIIHLEPYEKGIITNTTQYINTNNYTVSYKDINAAQEVYHVNDDWPLKNSELVLTADNNFYYIPAQDDKLTQVGTLSQADAIWDAADSYHWYSTNDITSKTYTVDQIFDNNIFVYYLSNTSLQEVEFTNHETAWTKNFSIVLNEYTIDADNVLIINQSSVNYPLVVVFDADEASSTQAVSIGEYNFTITRTRNNVYNLQEMTNGEFWYFFQNRIDIPNILSKVAVIATQLTTNWNAALTASHYCQWFLPDNWQNSINQNINYFATSLYHINEQNKISLLNTFIPNVEIYKYRDETWLPNYIFKYQDGSAVDTEGFPLSSSIEYLTDNPAYRDAVNHVLQEETNWNINMRYFAAQENGKRTYYYRVNGGTERKNILQKLDPTQKVYHYLDGLYCMQLRILFTEYINAPMQEYESLVNQKLSFWRRLYARFPGIFLENTYENKDVRNSIQLLTTAKLAFKDYIAPEKQYNITWLDAAALQGYEGQELHIGDGILLKTSDYYDGIDETYRALNQYLFISDISYTLRQDTDISLTVNTIKYQDKLLQSVVKLIR